jgi:oxygen-independent coproporphyrinogen-3 oxidase
MSLFDKRDNEFIAWYPPCVNADEAGTVWEPARTGYYVHIPFCSAICDYCGFAVDRLRNANVERYLRALHSEIDRYADAGRLAGREFACGHFGGGTPSAIEGAELVSVLEHVHRVCAVTPDAEITVEVNPISFTLDKAVAYREAGVNRISFGVQSFDDETLRVIGRPHRSGDVMQTLEVIDRAGFENYSLDLIYGVPGQTLEGLGRDLDRVIETGATHVSCFRLEIIPFTKLKLREAAGLLPDRLDGRTVDEMDDLVTERLTAGDYREYGVFNFAKRGFESVHNEIAFMAPQGEYFGFGNSSYSYAAGAIYTNEADVNAYVDAVESGRDPIALGHRVTALEEMSRYFVLGLKFFRVPRPPFISIFGLEPEEVFGDVLEALVDAGMIERTPEEYVLSRAGRHYVNNVSKQFYVGENLGHRQHKQFVPTLTVKEINRFAKLAGSAS